MSLLDKNAPGIKQILTVIPDELLTQLAENSKVDYCAKLLHGKQMFYLLLYGLLKIDRLSQRGLSDIYGSSLFKTLFNIAGNRQVTHSSISDRLSSIHLDFFGQSYEAIYKLLSKLYTEKEIEGLNLQRVDSSLVSEASNSLKEGLFCGNNKASKKKMIKYSMAFDGTFASLSRLHTDDYYALEERALPDVVKEHLKKTRITQLYMSLTEEYSVQIHLQN